MYEIVIGRKEEDKQKFGLRGTVLLGKQYVKMGQTTSLSNSIYLDVTRAHVMFIVGKRGSGKCLLGNSKITLSDGREVMIKDLEEDHNEIMSMNSGLKMQRAQKSHFYSRNANSILKITFRTGKSIELTPEHPLFTVKGWSEAQNLTVGSRIATPREIPYFGHEDMSEDRVKLLAYLIAEGHLGNLFVIFSNKDQKIVNDFKKSIDEFDDKLRVLKHSGPHCYRVSRKNILGSKINSLIQWMKKLNLYNKLSDSKFIPDCIFKLPRNKLSLFLNRLFSCDGSIYKVNNYWEISYCSINRELVEQVHSLLIRFGIVSRIRDKKTNYNGEKRPAYELVIGGEFVTKFTGEIGFYGDKFERSRDAVNDSIRIIRNPNVDTVPKEIWQLYKPNNWTELGRKIGYKHPKALRESTRYSPSRGKLLMLACAEENDLLEKFATSDIFWDEIISIEKKEGTFKVYDLTVPEHHNFVANNIIVHNSYAMGAVAEGVMDIEPAIAQNISMILLDTMGVYWTMKYPNKKDAGLLKDWGIKPRGMDVQIFTPIGSYQTYKDEGVPTDFPFSIQPNELDAEDWHLSFGLDRNSEIGVLIEKIINTLKDKEENFSLDDIVDVIELDKDSDKSIRDAAKNRFSNAKRWGLFNTEGTKLNDLVIGGKVTVLDVSAYATAPNGWAIKSLVIGLVAKKLFIERMKARRIEEFKDIKENLDYFKEEVDEKKNEPMVWLAIDEAHEFLPNKGETTASFPLITILREGRQPGISLILATQQPGKIHTDVMTQSDIVMSLRLTAKLDTDSLQQLAQSYMREGLEVGINQLPRVPGAAVILDDSNERIYPMRVRPKMTWHGGSAPTAIPSEKKTI